MVPWPGKEPRSPALAAWSLSHRATREVPGLPIWKVLNTCFSFFTKDRPFPVGASEVPALISSHSSPGCWKTHISYHKAQDFLRGPGSPWEFCGAERRLRPHRWPRRQPSGAHGQRAEPGCNACLGARLGDTEQAHARSSPSALMLRNLVA